MPLPPRGERTGSQEGSHMCHSTSCWRFYSGDRSLGLERENLQRQRITDLEHVNDSHRGSHMSEVTHYLYKIQPTRLEMLTQGPTPAEAEIISRHFAYLQQL